MPGMPSLAHPRLSRTLRELARSRAYRRRCAQPSPDLLVKGIEQFNAREFFECHETLEELWRAEDNPVRYLYQGILHVGVGYYHLGRGNHHGAVTKLESGIQLLEFYSPSCQGVEIAGLIQAARRSRDRLIELGPDRMREFDQRLIPRIELQQPRKRVARRRRK
jgi:predicted metal-dependent hydrolase